MKDLKNKNVVITGAAAGIGRLMAHEFAKNGSNLALIDIDKKLLTRTENELRQFGTRVIKYVCDISNEQNVKDTAKQIKLDFAHIDVLVNNAGIVNGKEFSDLSVNDIKRTMDVNFMGTVMMTKQFYDDMVTQQQGNIVNIASSAGLMGMAKMTDYCASKFADVGFSDSLRMELKVKKVKGVNITIVCPYVISTGMFDGFKPLLFNPVIKPEYVARKVVKAVKKNKTYLYLPPVGVYQIRVMLLLPKKLVDWLILLLGGGRAMSSFKGSVKK